MHNIHPSWNKLFNKYTFDIDILYEENIVYPPKDMLFKVFQMDIKEIKIVLLGQDPYHGKGQAHGLSFSVPTGTKIPPSLNNIFKELKLEFPVRNYQFVSGNLEKWFTREKIFLLNASLTVIESKAGSQMHIWEEFTNDVIKYISKKNKDCIFLLLGNFAKTKSEFINNKEKIITEVHPSPLARGFIGSDVFKKVEKCLGKEINWQN